MEMLEPLVTRAEWGALPPTQPWRALPLTLGVKIHYEGREVPVELALSDQHHCCAGRVREIQAMHLADTAQGWIDIAYNALVCPHGRVFEGRGAHRESGANGDRELNRAHYAVCAMIGDSGLTEPGTALLNGLCDAVDWLRERGAAGPEVAGHRDGRETDCPGEPLYRWIQAGAPRP
jgi:hypothetical protein